MHTLRKLASGRLTQHDEGRFHPFSGIESPASKSRSPNLARLMFSFALTLLLCAPGSSRRRSGIADAIHRRRFCDHGAKCCRPRFLRQAIYQGAIPGLLRVLDPHSVFFDPGQFDQLQKMQESTQKGFGSVVSLLPGA